MISTFSWSTIFLQLVDGELCHMVPRQSPEAELTADYDTSNMATEAKKIKNKKNPKKLNTYGMTNAKTSLAKALAAQRNKRVHIDPFVRHVP